MARRLPVVGGLFAVSLTGFARFLPAGLQGVAALLLTPEVPTCAMNPAMWAVRLSCGLRNSSGFLFTITLKAVGDNSAQLRGRAAPVPPGRAGTLGRFPISSMACVHRRPLRPSMLLNYAD